MRLDFNPSATIILSVRLNVRASSRGVLMVEPDAAPAGVVRSHASGTPRVAVRSNYVGLPSMAGRGVDEGRRKPPGCGVRARKHGPGGQKSRRWSAVWRTCLAKARQRRKALDRWLRRTALHSLAFVRDKERRASPGPRQRIRAMTLGCLTIESEKSGCRYTRR